MGAGALRCGSAESTAAAMNEAQSSALAAKPRGTQAGAITDVALAAAGLDDDCANGHGDSHHHLRELQQSDVDGKRLDRLARSLAVLRRRELKWKALEKHCAFLFWVCNGVVVASYVADEMA